MYDNTAERPEITEAKHQQIFRDYSGKIGERMAGPWAESGITAVEINDMVVLLNWCFGLKNNFFSKDFNRRSIFAISTAYNQLKSNILNETDALTPLDGITVDGLKILKFILNQYISVYDQIAEDNYHNELCGRISKDSVKRCSVFVGERLRIL
jgi:hypothetical protein